MPRRTRTKQTRTKRRHLNLEALESRRVMAANISEVLMGTNFGLSTANQYVELRGEPNAPLDNTYFVSVRSDRGFGSSNQEGRVQTIVNLSGLQFGENGYLVILPELANAIFNPIPAEGATVLRRDTNVVGGATDPRFSGGATLLPTNSATFMLIQTDVAPLIGDDIDADSNGVIDPAGIAQNWTILDSVSVLRPFVNQNHAYSRTVFLENRSTLGNPTVPPGATVIQEAYLSYVARIGESTGSRREDWVGGLVEIDSGVLRFDFSTIGQATTRAFNGRALDSLGDVNFTGSVQGTAFIDANSNGVRDLDELPLVGATVLADTNGNRVRDLLVTVIDPENMANGTELTNFFPGVTMTSQWSGNNESYDHVEVAPTFLNEGAGRRTLEASGLSWFSPSFPLRLDFYRPVRSVTIDFVARFGTDVGHLEAFDAQGNSIDVLETDPIPRSSRRSLTVESSDESIAYVTAYSESVGRIDRVQFSQSEQTAVTDSEGRYFLRYLDPAPYQLVMTAPDLFQTAPDESELSIPVTDRENYKVDFGFGPNIPPVLLPQDFRIPESPRVGRVVAEIPVRDPNIGQPLFFSLLAISGSAIDPLRPALELDSATGELRSVRPQDLDFERGSEVVLTVSVIDEPDAIPVVATYTITLEDVNEPPEMSATSFDLPEDAQVGTLIGTLIASDTDVGQAGNIRFDILDGNAEGIFALDAATGALTVAQPDLLDFEKVAGYILTVAATDAAQIPQRTIVPVAIDLSNTNELPRLISDNEIRVREDAPSESIVGIIRTFDPDPGQTLRVDVTGGTGAGVFDVDQETGRITLKSGAKLDYEKTQSLTLEVRITDNDTTPLSIHETVTITVDNVNEPPQIELSKRDAVLAEVSFPLLTPTRAITDVTLSDPEGASLAQGTLQWEVVGGTGQLLVEPSPDFKTLLLKQGVTLDYEGMPQWTVVLRAFETQTAEKLERFATVNVRVLNENEPPIIESTSIRVLETARPSSIVGFVKFRDPDAGQRVQLKVIGGNSELLEVDGFTGAIQLRADKEFDRENQPNLQLVVQAEDPEGKKAEATIQLTVVPVNQAPRPVRSIEPILVSSDGAFSAVIPAGIFSDPDLDTITLNLEGFAQTLPSWLRFDPITATLSGTVRPSDAGTYQLLLTATDNGTPNLIGTLPFDLVLEEVELPWHNESSPLDTNGDGILDPQDALVLINYLNALDVTAVRVPADGGGLVNFFPDVDQDNFVTTLDILAIINELNRIADENAAASEPLPPANVDAAFADEDDFTDDSEAELLLLF